ncbi:MAG: ABC transporter ATP-binding protein [Methanomassiliicoccales archaeon]
MLELRDVSKVFLDYERGKGLVALSHINLKVEKGEFVCLIGPSGCGKTTLLNVAAGFERPTKGEVLFEGRRLDGPGPDRAVVFQEFSLFPWMSVLENIEFALRAVEADKRQREKRAKFYLNLVGLSNFQAARPSDLSGGMKQRVAIARALAMDPQVLLMDEPFGSLDEQTRRRLDSETLCLWKVGRKGVIFVTHNIEEAIFLGTRVVLMSPSPGRIMKEWKINLEWPRDPASQEFASLKKEISSNLHICACAKTSASSPETLTPVVIEENEKIG